MTPPLFQETPPNHGNSEISDISPVDQTGSRAFSVARDKLKPWTDSDIRDRHKDVRKHFLRILKQSQPAGEEKVDKNT